MTSSIYQLIFGPQQEQSCVEAAITSFASGKSFSQSAPGTKIGTSQPPGGDSIGISDFSDGGIEGSFSGISTVNPDKHGIRM